MFQEGAEVLKGGVDDLHAAVWVPRASVPALWPCCLEEFTQSH